jgi:hypothetical protein
MLKGLARKLLRVPEIMGERLFRSRTELPSGWSDTYAGRDETPALGINRRHSLAYAT